MHNVYKDINYNLTPRLQSIAQSVVKIGSGHAHGECTIKHMLRRHTDPRSGLDEESKVVA